MAKKKETKPAKKASSPKTIKSKPASTGKKVAVKKTVKTSTASSKKITVKAASPKKNTKTEKKVTPKKVAKNTRSGSEKATALKKAPVKKATADKKIAVKKLAPKTTVVAKEKKKVKNESQKLSDAAVEGILEVKGKNVSLLDLTDIQNRVCDYFIICQADSTTQVNAIANSVIEIVKKQTGERPYRSEGFENSEWILIDYVTVVVHVFQSHIREFYNLEALWADAEETKIAFD